MSCHLSISTFSNSGLKNKLKCRTTVMALSQIFEKHIYSKTVIFWPTKCAFDFFLWTCPLQEFQVSLSTWSVFLFEGRMNPKNWSSETARLKRACRRGSTGDTSSSRLSTIDNQHWCKDSEETHEFSLLWSGITSNLSHSSDKSFAWFP